MTELTGQAKRLAREKGDRQDWMTSTELATYLGMTSRRFRKWQQAGKVPDPEARTVSGWGLWSPAQQVALLNKKVKHQ